MFEVVFAPPRKWRFDVCWPVQKVALEVDGGIWVGGRHNRGAAMKAQWEKENTAVCMGWRILKVEPKDMCMLSTVEMLRRVL